MSSSSKMQHYGHQQQQQSLGSQSPEFSPLSFSPRPESPPLIQHQQPLNRKAAYHHAQPSLFHQQPSLQHSQYQRSSYLKTITASGGSTSAKSNNISNGYSSKLQKSSTVEQQPPQQSLSHGPIAIDNEEEIPDDSPRDSCFNMDWNFSGDHLRLRTPSRRDGISYEDELKMRRTGTTFIADMARRLKLKPICKETATVYFHRFYMLRSLSKYSEKRIATVCLYLASKFEDHPMFKDYFIAMYCCLTSKPLKKTDKEFQDYCDRLIMDENLLLQVLGFNLQIKHFHVLIVGASQRPIEGTTKQFYANSYKIASDVNRLTMLCLQYSSEVLACITLYLAACYTKVKLPKGWTSVVLGEAVIASSSMKPEEIERVVCQVGEEYRLDIARNSKTAQGMIQQHQTPPQSAGAESMSKSMMSKSPFYQQIMTSFSPDSAYSSSGGSVKSDTLSPPKLGLSTSTIQQQQSKASEMMSSSFFNEILMSNGSNNSQTTGMYPQQLKRAYQQETEMIQPKNKRAHYDHQQQHQHLTTMMLMQQQQQQQQVTGYALKQQGVGNGTGNGSSTSSFAMGGSKSLLIKSAYPKN